MKRRRLFIIFLMVASFIVALLLVSGPEHAVNARIVGAPFRDGQGLLLIPATNHTRSMILWTVTYRERPKGTTLGQGTLTNQQIVTYHLSPGEGTCYEIKIKAGNEYNVISVHRTATGGFEKRIRLWVSHFPLLKGLLPQVKSTSEIIDWFDAGAIATQNATNASPTHTTAP
jgi:hypothetical protein